MKKTERSRCSGRMTEAQFTTFIKSQLRRATMRWAPITETLKEARVERGYYKCNSCKNVVPVSVIKNKKRIKNIQINHKVPVSLPNSWDGWDGFISRLFCEKEGLEALCSDCHDSHTILYNNLTEDWKSVEGFENYEISSYGRVRHKENGLRHLVEDRYLRCRMWSTKDKKYVLHLVHRLVAKAFIPNPQNLPCVNHKDCYKWNNFMINLEWTSYQGNLDHAKENDLYPTGEDHHNFVGYWVTPKGIFTNLKEAAFENQISTSYLRKLCKQNLNNFSFESKLEQTVAKERRRKKKNEPEEI